MSDELPAKCIRGIPNKSNNFIREDGTPAPALFFFGETYPRDDQWIEQSINWMDDDNAVEFTLAQKRDDGQFQFQGGTAILSRSEIDLFNRLENINGILSYERRALDQNSYHGNLLLRKDVSRHKMKSIADFLALISKIQPRKEDETR